MFFPGNGASSAFSALFLASSPCEIQTTQERAPFPSQISSDQLLILHLLNFLWRHSKSAFMAPERRGRKMLVQGSGGTSTATLFVFQEHGVQPCSSIWKTWVHTAHLPHQLAPLSVDSLAHDGFAFRSSTITLETPAMVHHPTPPKKSPNYAKHGEKPENT